MIVGDVKDWEVVYRDKVLPREEALGSLIPDLEKTRVWLEVRPKGSEVLELGDFQEEPVVSFEPTEGDLVDLGEVKDFDQIDVPSGIDLRGGPEDDSKISDSEFELTLDDSEAPEAGSEVVARDDTGIDLEQDEESASKVVALDEGVETLRGGLTEIDLAEDYDDEFGLFAEIEEAEEAPATTLAPQRAAAPAQAPATKPKRGKVRKVVQRQATVRFYSRMNPDRVFPFLVILSEKMIEKIIQKHVGQQASGPFKVKKHVPVEVEPILPGCVCYPPKVTTRVGKETTTLTFHVVPHVLGKVTGAKVLIRQDHEVLAEIELDIRVVQRTWLLVSSFLTFLLPFGSSIAQYYHLDFASQLEDGFNLYLTLAHLILAQVTPLTLTVILAAATFVCYWFTRPKREDRFGEIKTISPQQKLDQIQKEIAADPEELMIEELKEVVRAAPDLQPARLLLAKQFAKAEDYEESLNHYSVGLKLGPAGIKDYMRAAQAAGRLGQYRRALELLQVVDRVADPKKKPGVLFYNIACYHTLLGELEEAMVALHKAVKGGYRKVEQYFTDSDLDPLRQRQDFQNLLRTVKRGK